MQRNLAYFNVKIPKSFSKIDLHLCFVSYYYSQVDKMAIYLLFLHQMIIFYLTSSVMVKLYSISLPCPGSACIVSVVICDQISLLIFT